MVSYIAAMSENRVIGNHNGVPWGKNQKADMKRFRDLTLGHTIIMGRITYEEFKKPLDNRLNIVITLTPSVNLPNVLFKTFEETKHYIQDNDEELFVIGGQKIFELFLPYVEKIYLTEINAKYEGNVFFPEFDLTRWDKISESCHEADDENLHAYCFQEYFRQ